MKIGDVVISIAGHDIGEWYIIENTLGDNVFLVDGKHKLMRSPKQKRIKHIVKTNFYAKEIASNLKLRQNVYDADVQKALKFFKNKVKENACQKKM